MSNEHEALIVEQRHRDAAKELMHAVRGFAVGLPNDGHFAIQAFARFEASLATPSPSIDTRERREAIARIIAPDAMRSLETLRAEWQRWADTEQPAWGDGPRKIDLPAMLDRMAQSDHDDLAAARHRALKKADAILALTPSPRVDEGRAREVLAKIMNRHASRVLFHDKALAEEAWTALATTPADPRAGEGRDTEADAWAWLERKFGTESDDPVDRAYAADEMVDAFHAGRTASADPRVGKIEADLEAAIISEAQFLCARLDELDFGQSMDDFTNMHSAHVDPSHSRLKKLLSQIEGPATAAAFASTEPPAPTP